MKCKKCGKKMVLESVLGNMHLKYYEYVCDCGNVVCKKKIQ